MNFQKKIKWQLLNKPEETLIGLIASTIPFMLNLGNFTIIIAVIYATYLSFKKKKFFGQF